MLKFCFPVNSKIESITIIIRLNLKFLYSSLIHHLLHLLYNEPIEFKNNIRDKPKIVIDKFQLSKIEGVQMYPDSKEWEDGTKCPLRTR